MHRHLALKRGRRTATSLNHAVLQPTLHFNDSFFQAVGGPKRLTVLTVLFGTGHRWGGFLTLFLKGCFHFLRIKSWIPTRQHICNAPGK